MNGVTLHANATEPFARSGGFKTVTAIIVLTVADDQPLEDWLPSLVSEQLGLIGESLDSYVDNEPDGAGGGFVFGGES